MEKRVEHIYRTLLENILKKINEGVIVLSQKKEIIFVNKKILEMLDCQEEDILNKEIFTLISKKELDFFKKKIDLVEQGKRCSHEVNLSYQKKEVAGTLNHISFEKNKDGLDSDFALFYIITNISKARKFTKETEKKTEELIKAATMDNLTGVLNYTQFLNLLSIEFERAKRYFTHLSCLIIDMDDFKRINEEFSFSFGDEMLKNIATCIINNCRKSDIIARFGGEKFIILLPNTNYQYTLIVAEKLRNKIEHCAFINKDKIIKLTFSAGVSSVIEDGVKDPKSLLKNAQEAVKVAKNEKKNKVLLFKDTIITRHKVDYSESKIVNLRKRIVDITQDTKESYIESLRALIMALEARDPYTKEHSITVSKYSYLVAKEMKLPESQAELIKTAGLLHDIGKIGISDAILLKKGVLSKEEFRIIHLHPIYGVNIIHPIKYLAEEQPIILYHHERIDGKGYPEGLKGRRIPLGARILCVVDSFDAMSSPRPYREPLELEKAVRELINHSGTQFDPEVAYNLIVVLIKNKIIPDIFEKDKKLHEDIIAKCQKYL